MVDLTSRHLALIGFMGAGKTTVGKELARLLARPFVDVDAELEQRQRRSIPELFAEHGEPWFRQREAELVAELVRNVDPSVIALGGGAAIREGTRELLRGRTRIAHVDESVEVCWRRAALSDRPLAQDEASFRALFDERAGVYAELADVAGSEATEIVLALGDVFVRRGAYQHLDRLVPGEGPFVLVADEAVLALHPPPDTGRIGAVHSVPSGEAAKTLAVCEALWNELDADRSTQLVALGGGTTTDVAGFVAATYLRGLGGWTPVPSTLVGQVDAAIGGKTAIDLAKGKNLVGAFKLPERVLIDPALLETLPAEQLVEGKAEVVKTGLLSGRPLWEQPLDEQVRRTAAFKTAVCLTDPEEAGRRAILNLGHTFAHGLEAAGAYAGLTHGHAVALGLRAALRLSVEHRGLDASILAEVEEALAVDLASVDADAAWAAMAHDKKAKAGRLRLVLLDGPGEPVWGVELPEASVRGALESLIAPR